MESQISIKKFNENKKTKSNSIIFVCSFVSLHVKVASLQGQTSVSINAELKWQFLLKSSAIDLFLNNVLLQKILKIGYILIVHR
jgi:hypothetical protein